MNIAVLREAIFYEYYSNQAGGFFMNITIPRQAVLFYEHCSTERGGFL
jgi:hypothetical protein